MGHEIERFGTTALKGHVVCWTRVDQLSRRIDVAPAPTLPRQQRKRFWPSPPAERAALPTTCPRTCHRWPPWSWAAARWTAPHWSGGWWATACWAGSRWKTGWSPAATHWFLRCGPACWARCHGRLRSCSRRPPDELRGRVNRRKVINRVCVHVGVNVSTGLS